MKQWYGELGIRVVKKLDSDMFSGLNVFKIQKMKELYGENKILKPKTKSVLNLILEEIKKVWIIVAFLNVCILFYLRNFKISIISLVFIVLSIISMVYIENKKEKALKSIEKFNNYECRVIRNGKTLKILSEELVVGDIVYLEKGNSVPADIRILESENLKVKEVSVTGEDYEVEKYSMKMEETVMNLSEIKNIVFKSSSITRGNGLGIVIAVGMQTQIGNIIKVLLDDRNDNKVFNERLNKLTKYLSMSAFACSMVMISLALIFHQNVKTSLMFMSATLTSIIPQVTILVLMLFLYIVSKQFKKNRIHIRNISSIYELEKVTTIFADKIGAFSKNKMVTKKMYCDNELINVTSLKFELQKGFERTLSIGLLCNDAYGNEKDNIMEKEILDFAKHKGIDADEVQMNHRRILYIPYDAEKKIKTTINIIEDNYRANVRGNVEKLLTKCTHIMIDGVERELKDEDINNIKAAHIEMSNKLLTVEGFAYRNFTYEPTLGENIESNLVFVGLMGFSNPLKENAYEAITFSKIMGIKPLLVMEDNKLLSFALGKELKIIGKQTGVLSGVEMKYMNNDEFERVIEKVSIFSKINIMNKIKIINTLKKKGNVIASFGRNLTDLPYLSSSDISVAVGTDCSNMVKKLSDVYMEENDYMNMVKLIKESENIITFMKKASFYILSCGISHLVTLLISLIVFKEMPLSITNIFCLNYVIVFIGALAILLQNRKENMHFNYINNENIKIFSVKNGVIMGIVTFMSFALCHKYGSHIAQKITFHVLAIYEIIYTYLYMYRKKIFNNKLSILLLIITLVLSVFTLFYVLFTSFNKGVLNQFSAGKYVIILSIIFLLYLIIGGNKEKKTENYTY